MHTSVEDSLFRSEDYDNQESHIFPLKYSDFCKVPMVKSSWMLYSMNLVSAASESQSLGKE